jgi:hypothetical protein
MTSHILLNRLPRLLCFTVTLLFAARLCQAACIPTDTTKPPNQRPNQDALALLLKAQATCPLNTPDFLKLVEGSGARLAPTMVNFHGFRNQDLDSGVFFIFEIVSGPLAGVNVERGDFLFGHFLSNKGSQLILQEGGLMIEAIAWDPAKRVFNFYELTEDDCKPSQASWCYRGDSSFVLQDIEFLYRQVAGQQPFHDRLRCSGCHVSGGLIQKELAPPHNDWETKSRPLLHATPDPTVAKIFQGLVDADELGKLVQAASRRLAASPEYRKALQSRTMQEQLRPLFCAVELNIESDPDFVDDKRPAVQIPAGFFADPRLGASSIAIPRANYDQALDRRKLHLPQTPGRKDADHAWLTPVKADSDMVMIGGLVEMGVVDSEFVADVLAVDFTNPLFSPSRCGLLTLVPAKGGPDFVTRFQAALKASSKPAAKQLLDNLTDPKRDAKFHRQQVSEYLDACQKRSSQLDAAKEWFDVLVQ